MENKVEENNDEIKEETHNENKINYDNQNLSNLNKNKMSDIYKLLINSDYYLICQNLEKELKSFHKSIMQNIGKMNKILFNNNISNNNDESNSLDLKEKGYLNEYSSMIDILNKIELNHNNFYLNSKKILLKMIKHCNKRKKTLKKYKIIEENKYYFTFGLISQLKENSETDDISHKIKKY